MDHGLNCKIINLQEKEFFKSWRPMARQGVLLNPKNTIHRRKG